MKTLNLTVNGKAVAANLEPRTSLADFLRDTLGLTGTHLGCEHGVCGACTLLVDGMPARSCITLALACDGADITTIEGLDDDAVMRQLRAAFSREHALQCGYCTPGMLASARDIVLRLPDAGAQDIRVALSGNLCRCTGYVGIVRAIESVLAERKAQGVGPALAPRTALGPAGSAHAQPAGPGSPGPAAAAPIAASSASRPPAAPSQSATAGAMDKPQATLRQSFSVDHRRDKVWAFFGRLGDVTTCLPGTTLIGTPTDDHVEPRIRIKAGPIIAEFEGVADAVRDPSNYSGAIRGSARDARSSSMMRGEIRYLLLEDKDGTATRVDVEVGYTLTGPLAQFGRSSIVQDIAARMTASFARNLQQRLDQGDGGSGAATQALPAAELDAGALVFSVLWERIRAFCRNLWRR
ncbi:MAG TPA: 2Fe-2S iron-sulfur cluster-binding protein [Casimicrobiaceae bacterium]